MENCKMSKEYRRESDQELLEKLQVLAEELDQNREDYAKEIRDMQQCIRRVTDKSVKIQAQEARNKELMREKFATIHRQAKAVRKNSRAITGYYNSMKEVKMNWKLSKSLSTTCARL